MASIPELDTIQFDSSKSIAQYSRAGRNLMRDLAREFDEAAAEIQHTLTRLNKDPFWRHLRVRWRARRVASHLRKAGECARSGAVEVVKFNAQYRQEFLDPAVAKRNPRRTDWQF
jgi:hypothetical protein